MMSFVKKNKKWFVSAIFVAYLIHAVPVFLAKSGYVNVYPQNEEITFLMR